ncbi:hypothetical protein ADUPG1_007802 [Aduncisulcus paluster]|uniref:Uncharacterized protein n=1 Tax=Aduncisulcus paluster TaxID=2918883 RepID=A0ABQ5KTW0_9EUKA|nr:hypothetical protein ADUPG1_007802 [Aduncisulcus paluster]
MIRGIFIVSHGGISLYSKKYRSTQNVGLIAPLLAAIIKKSQQSCLSEISHIILDNIAISLVRGREDDKFFVALFHDPDDPPILGNAIGQSLLNAYKHFSPKFARSSPSEIDKKITSSLPSIFLSSLAYLIDSQSLPLYTIISPADMGTDPIVSPFVQGVDSMHGYLDSVVSQHAEYDSLLHTHEQQRQLHLSHQEQQQKQSTIKIAQTPHQFPSLSGSHDQSIVHGHKQRSLFRSQRSLPALFLPSFTFSTSTIIDKLTNPYDVFSAHLPALTSSKLVGQPSFFTNTQIDEISKMEIVSVLQDFDYGDDMCRQERIQDILEEFDERKGRMRSGKRYFSSSESTEVESKLKIHDIGLGSCVIGELFDSEMSEFVEYADCVSKLLEMVQIFSHG